MSYACKVDRHGAYHLELELSYPLPSTQQDSKYVVDLFLFTPPALGLTRERYGVQGFLHDLKSYTRYTLCATPLSKLLDPACEISPLARIERVFRNLESSRTIDTGKLLYELKILVDLHHDEVGNQRDRFKQHLSDGLSQDNLGTYLSAYLRDGKALTAAIRDLYPKFAPREIPETLRQALRLADESISIKTEKEIHHLLNMLQETGREHTLTHDLAQWILAEQAYRKTMGFASLAGPDFCIQNEAYVYRESNLKKWAQSATYMTQEADKTPVRIGHILASIAAAIAMGFAVFAALITQKYYNINTLPWAFLIIAAYMFKDRIKEIVRTGLINMIPSLVADRVMRLTDPLGNQNVGQSRERIRFCDSTSTPPDIQQMRSHHSETFRSILPPERVVHFRKALWLKNRKLLSNHQRLVGITEIIRLNLGSWLGEMDDPVDELFAMRDGKSCTVKTRRVYHMNLIVRLSGFGQSSNIALFKQRIILTRNGIDRVESIY